MRNHVIEGRRSSYTLLIEIIFIAIFTALKLQKAEIKKKSRFHTHIITINDNNKNSNIYVLKLCVGMQPYVNFICTTALENYKKVKIEPLTLFL